MSATIIPILNGAAFDPEVLHAMGEAYNAAKTALPDNGQSPQVQQLLAERILDIANTGERDPRRICFGIETQAIHPASKGR